MDIDQKALDVVREVTGLTECVPVSDHRWLQNRAKAQLVIIRALNEAKAEALGELYEKVGHQTMDGRPWASACLKAERQYRQQAEEAPHESP